MDRTLTNFIHALRMADVRISTAETLDAMNTVELVGYKDRAFLKDSLSLVLPKTADEKETFDTCFDQFFAFEDVSGEQSSQDNNAESDDADHEGGEGEGGEGGSGGQRQPGEPAQSGKKKSKKKKPNNNLYEEEEEEDLGPGEMTEPSSDLGQLLMSNSNVELTMAMAQAGEEVNVRDIQIFTQKGLYTRRIMDAMGLAELNGEIGGLREAPQIPARRLGQELKRRRDWLREQVARERPDVIYATIETTQRKGGFWRSENAGLQARRADR